VNDSTYSIKLPIQCPNVHNGCKSEHLIKTGHDTSVKSRTQKFYCKDCDCTFYAHTSGVFKDLDDLFNEFLINLVKDGRLDQKAISHAINCSNSTVSQLFKVIANVITTSLAVKNAWDAPMSGSILFIDETWVKIQHRTWYIVVVVNEAHHVLTWALIRRREADVILPIVEQAISRLKSRPPVIVTDDFSTYKRVVVRLGYDLIHVRHIHKPPYGRMVLDKIEHAPPKIRIAHVATTNDIFCNSNTFLVRMSQSEIKSPEKGKRGRKPGSKKGMKPQHRPPHTTAASKPKKRGPKNAFKEGIIQVYHYTKKAGLVCPLGGADKKVAEMLELVGHYFPEKYVTTNLVENVFSALKKLVNFRGKRSIPAWNLVLEFYFTIRQYPAIVKQELRGLALCRNIINRSLDLKFKLLPITTKIMSEVV